MKRRKTQNILETIKKDIAKDLKSQVKKNAKNNKNKSTKDGKNNVGKSVNNNEKYLFTSIRITIFVISFLLTFVLGLYFKTPIESFVNLHNSDNANVNVFDYDGLTIHFINIGQGDAIAIDLPDDTFILIDAGDKLQENNLKLLSYLNESVFKNVVNPTFEYVILTHSDADHCGGMPTVFNNFQINNFYRPCQYVTDNLSSYDDDLNKVITSNNTVNTVIYKQTILSAYSEPNCNMLYNFNGEIIENEIYNYKFEFLTPNNEIYNNANNYSPIILMSYKNKTVLFTGDAESAVENEAIPLLPNENIDILKVGHHGSNTSSSSAFLETIKPSYAVISCGLNNSYNHPNPQALARLKNDGEVLEGNILRTDLNGDIVANISTTGVILFNCSTESLPMFIEVEYLIGVLVIAEFCVCFINFNKVDNKKEKI